MLFDVWLGVVILAIITSIASFVLWRSPALFFLTGVLWLIVAFNCSNIEFIITYSSTGYNYLKSFKYPSLALFFSLIAVICFLIFLAEMYDILKETASEAIS